jgi:DNA-binding NarL/FixJ family response regulator
MEPLSANELEVLQEFANGLGTTEIAASRRTTAQVIKNYTYRACQTLGHKPLPRRRYAAR